MQRISRHVPDAMTGYRDAGYKSTGHSPFGIGGAVAVHAALLGAYLLIPAAVIERYVPTIMVGRNIPLPPPPDKPIEKRVDRHPLQQPHDQKPYVPDQTVDLHPTDGGTSGGTIATGDAGTGPTDTIVIKDLPAVPVLVDVAIDPRYRRDFQPGYPPSMQRMQQEGKVTVRVRIGSDGRVIALEKLFATNDAFWTATQAQALRKWRFRPATRDGAAVEGETVLTVHFQLTE